MGDVGQDFGRYAHDSEPIGEADPAVEFGDPRGQVVAGVQADRSSEAVVLFGRRGLVVSDARVRRSGMTAARTGRISKEGSAEARRVLVEAAWSAKRVPGPLRAFGQLLQARRGPQIATVAVARKIAVLCWHLLTRAEDYAHHRPTLHRRKLRKLELRAGAPSQQGKHNPNPIWETRSQDERERDLVAQAEASYQRMVADWNASGPKQGTGAAPGRAHNAARQDQAPDPAL